jgi:hypothetical protein
MCVAAWIFACVLMLARRPTAPLTATPSWFPLLLRRFAKKLLTPAGKATAMLIYLLMLVVFGVFATKVHVRLMPFQQRTCLD